MSTTTKAAEFADGLRALAEWCEQHPEYTPTYTMPFNAYVGTREDLVAARRALGAVSKSAVSTVFYIHRDFGGGVALEINVPREEVCRKVVKGTREVPEKVVPAHVEEDVEWVCDEPLLRAADEAVTA